MPPTTGNLTNIATCSDPHNQHISHYCQFPNAFKETWVTLLLKKPTLIPQQLKTTDQSLFCQLCQKLLFSPSTTYLTTTSLGQKQTLHRDFAEVLRLARVISKSSFLILLHLSVAFDTINPQSLLANPYGLGITGTPVASVLPHKQIFQGFMERRSV